MIMVWGRGGAGQFGRNGHARARHEAGERQSQNQGSRHCQGGPPYSLPGRDS